MHAVNVYVRDQERSLRFFLDTLGFQVAFDARVESCLRWHARRDRRIERAEGRG
jgi:catechol 2,3-dioxygenase-like lactoylglutathione lyase family enzyme